MEQPLYALLVAPDLTMRRNILFEDQTVSIRAGHRDYHPGPVMLCCQRDPWAVMADIITVRHCLLSEVTEEEYRDDGFRTQEDMLAGLKRYYPDMTLNSPVTVIRWKNVRGFLFDHRLVYAQKVQK